MASAGRTRSPRRATKKRSRKAGLPPGSLVHIGERKAETTRITLFRYDEERVEERIVETAEECLPEEKTSWGITWINVDGVHDTTLLEKLGTAYGLHPLTLEDIANTDQHPKFEDYDNYLYVVLKMLEPGRGSELVDVEQLSLVLGPDFVLSFQERQGDTFEPIRQRIRTAKGRLRKMGADYLAYTLMDNVVDHYFFVLEDLEERIERIEFELLEGKDSRVLPSIQPMSRELIYLRRSVSPLREAIGGLHKGESNLVGQPTQIYLRDVYDHSVQIMDALESFRALMSALVELHLVSASNRMNNVVRVLTIISTIFIPPTFIAGIYGMNFRHMPELGWSWGYPAVLVAMGLTGLFTVAFFYRKGWL